MARSPAKRRGITLGHLTESAASLDLLNAHADSTPVLSVRPPSDMEARDGGSIGVAEALARELGHLQRINADLGARWRHQTVELQEQLRLLEEQRNQITLQTRQLQALEQRRRSSGRLGFLMTLLVISGVSALGYHSWPSLQVAAGNLERLSAGVAVLAPAVRAVQGEVTSLSSRMGQMGSAMVSLEGDIAGTRSDLATLRKAADTSPDKNGAAQPDAEGLRHAAYTVPRNTTTASNPYWAMRPRMPW